MAQRTIHILFATLLADKIELYNKNRFLIGSIFPDAYINPTDRKTTHFIKCTSDESCLYFDFHEFLERFQSNVIDDDLYLGYYAHLVEDTFYRYFLNYEKNLIAKIKSYELGILHNDYHILNSYITKKYALPAHLELPKDYEKEVLNEITEFDVKQIVQDYSNDIVEIFNEKTVLLTEDMLEEFVLRYIDIIADELCSVRNTHSKLNVLDYKWKNEK